MVVIPLAKYEMLTGKRRNVSDDSEREVIDVPTSEGIVVKEVDRIGIDNKGRLKLDDTPIANTSYQRIIDYLNDKKPAAHRAPNGTKKVLNVLKGSKARSETIQREGVRKVKKGDRRNVRKLLKSLDQGSLGKILSRYGSRD